MTDVGELRLSCIFVMSIDLARRIGRFLSPAEKRWTGAVLIDSGVKPIICVSSGELWAVSSRTVVMSKDLLRRIRRLFTPEEKSWTGSLRFLLPLIVVGLGGNL